MDGQVVVTNQRLQVPDSTALQSLHKPDAHTSGSRLWAQTMLSRDLDVANAAINLLYASRGAMPDGFTGIGIGIREQIARRMGLDMNGNAQYVMPDGSFDAAGYEQAFEQALNTTFGNIDVDHQLANATRALRYTLNPAGFDAIHGVAARMATEPAALGMSQKAFAGMFAHDNHSMIVHVSGNSGALTTTPAKMDQDRSRINQMVANRAVAVGLAQDVSQARTIIDAADMRLDVTAGMNPVRLQQQAQRIEQTSAQASVQENEQTSAQAGLESVQSAPSQQAPAQHTQSLSRDLSDEQGDRVERNRLFREFVFARMVLEYNAANSEHPIMCSQARLIRASMETAGFYMTNQPTSVRDMMNDAVAKSAQFDIDWSNIDIDAVYNDAVIEYAQMTGFSSSGNGHGNEHSTAVNHVLPISPYDPRFAMNNSMLDYGSAIGAVDRSSLSATGWSRVLNDVKASRSVTVIHAHDRMRFDAPAFLDVRDNKSRIRQLTDNLDVLGVCAMRPLMKEDDWRTVAKYLGQSLNNTDIDSMDIPQARLAASQGTWLLGQLSERGINYHVEPDTMSGQLKARLDDAPYNDTDIRVYDMNPDNRRYLGRVTRGNVISYISSTFNPRASSMALDREHWPLMIEMLDQSLGRNTLDDPLGTVNITNYDRKSRRAVPVAHHRVYRNNDYHMAMLGPDTISRNTNGSPVSNYGHQLRIVSELKYAKAQTREQIDSPSKAEAFLRTSIDDARKNLKTEINVEGLIQAADHYLMNGSQEADIAMLSANDDVAAVQQSYWNVLTGKASTLTIPGQTSDKETEALLDGEDSKLDDRVFTGDEHSDWPSIVRRHAGLVVDSMIGTYKPGGTGLDDNLRFDPDGVADWCENSRSRYAVCADIEASMKQLDISVDQLRGDADTLSFMADRLVSFDPTDAKPMNTQTSPFMRHMHQVLVDSLASQGVELVGEPLIDANGVVQYTGRQYTSATDPEPSEYTGTIGQIFEPDEHGVVRTKFAASQNAAYIYGYDASLSHVPGDARPWPERLRLRGFEQRMADSIRNAVREQALGQGDVREATSVLNRTYRAGYSFKRPVDFVERWVESGMSREEVDLLVDTMHARVHLDRDTLDNSSFARAIAKTHASGYDPADDNDADAFTKTGHTDISVIDSQVSGYFDPSFTTATTTDQGGILYLADSAKVDADGRLIKGQEMDTCRMHKSDWFRYAGHNPFDREAMTLSNLMSASCVSKPVGCAQMTMSGYGFDDGMVVSKKFADEYRIRDANGNLRPLVKQDKISDLYGNKGVICEIVDPDMSQEYAQDKGGMYYEAWQWFKANPNMDVVMSPYSAVSRFNAGTALEMMEHPSDLNTPAGDTLPGSLGQLRFIITDKAADIKTHAYDDEAIKAGKGRKFSAQAAWALCAKGADKIAREVYSGNDHVIRDLREQVVCLGLDITPDGKFVSGYHPAEGEQRRVLVPQFDDSMLRVSHQSPKSGPAYDRYTMPTANTLAERWAVQMNDESVDGDDIDHGEDNAGHIDVTNSTGAAASRSIARTGGFMALPFELSVKWPDGAVPLQKDEQGRTLLPVMSARLRSNRRFNDGRLEINDATTAYRNIYDYAMRYQAYGRMIDLYSEKLADPNIEPELATKYRSLQASARQSMEKLPAKAQSAFDSVTSKLKTRLFTGKRNMAREALMSRRMPNSATAVWSADASLDIDQVAVSPQLCEVLGVKTDDYVLLWRDPVLRDSGMRYMRVKEDASINGCAICPIMDKGFDGDYDGDTVALVTLHDEDAKQQAKELFSVEANLLDPSHIRDDDEYDLNMHGATLDLASVAYDQQQHGVTGGFAERHELLRHQANVAAGDLEHSRQVMQALSELYQDSFEGSAGLSVLRFDSKTNFVNSLLDATVNCGAKGSIGKIRGDAAHPGFMQYAGLDAKFVDDGNGHWKVDGEVSETGTIPGRDAIEGVMTATAVKSFGTGVAGRFSQNAIKAVRSECAAAALEVTQPCTQSCLQSKHDPVEAVQRFMVMREPLRALWSGYAVTKQGDEWRVDYDTHGNKIQLNPDQWQEQMKALYTDKDGLNVDINPILLAQVADSLKGPDGMMLDVRGGTLDTMKTMSALDFMAYDDQMQMLEDFHKCAQAGVDLFQGDTGIGADMFMPRIIRINKELQSKGEPMKSLAMSDTLETGRAKGAAPKLAAGASYDTTGLPDWVKAMHGLSFVIEHKDDMPQVDMTAAQAQAKAVTDDAMPKVNSAMAPAL